MVFGSYVFLVFSVINESCDASLGLNRATKRTSQVTGNVFINFPHDPAPEFPQRMQPGRRVISPDLGKNDPGESC